MRHFVLLSVLILTITVYADHEHPGGDRPTAPARRIKDLVEILDKQLDLLSEEVTSLTETYAPEAFSPGNYNHFNKDTKRIKKYLDPVAETSVMNLVKTLSNELLLCTARTTGPNPPVVGPPDPCRNIPPKTVGGVCEYPGTRKFTTTDCQGKVLSERSEACQLDTKLFSCSACTTKYNSSDMKIHTFYRVLYAGKEVDIYDLDYANQPGCENARIADTRCPKK